MSHSSYKQQYQAYAVATQTVAKTKQIIMLYDGVIRFLQQAKEAMQDKRIEDRYHLLVKTSEIINGLQACLDFENGGAIARVLYGFYSSVDNRVFALHRSNSIESCEELIVEIKQMRDAWAEIDQGNESQDSSTPVLPVVDGAVPAQDSKMTLSA